MNRILFLYLILCYSLGSSCQSRNPDNNESLAVVEEAVAPKADPEYTDFVPEHGEEMINVDSVQFKDIRFFRNFKDKGVKAEFFSLDTSCSAVSIYVYKDQDSTITDFYLEPIFSEEYIYPGTGSNMFVSRLNNSYYFDGLQSNYQDLPQVVAEIVDTSLLKTYLGIALHEVVENLKMQVGKIKVNGLDLFDTRQKNVFLGTIKQLCLDRSLVKVNLKTESYDIEDDRFGCEWSEDSICQMDNIFIDSTYYANIKFYFGELFNPGKLCGMFIHADGYIEIYEYSNKKWELVKYFKHSDYCLGFEFNTNTTSARFMDINKDGIKDLLLSSSFGGNSGHNVSYILLYFEDWKLWPSQRFSGWVDYDQENSILKCTQVRKSGPDVSLTQVYYDIDKCWFTPSRLFEIATENWNGYQIPGYPEHNLKVTFKREGNKVQVASMKRYRKSEHEKELQR